MVQARFLIVVIAAASLVFAGQAQAQRSSGGGYDATEIEGKTEVDKAIGRCVVAVGGGVILGALLGGEDKRREGALAGGAVGGVICLVMLSVASKKDKKRLREAQLRALNSGEVQTAQWRTDDGKQATAVITPSPVVEVVSRKTDETLICRRANTKITVGANNNNTSDVVCLVGDSWLTTDQLSKQGIRPSDIDI